MCFLRLVGAVEHETLCDALWVWLFQLGLGSSLFAPFFPQMGVFPNVSGAGLNIIDIWSVDAIRVSDSKFNVSQDGYSV